MSCGSVNKAVVAKIAEAAERLNGAEREFFLRVWSTNPETYRARIRAAGFFGLGDVLDAGCGFGQWALPLAEVNRTVSALDRSAGRLRLLSELVDLHDCTNVQLTCGEVEQLPYPERSFDGIFCYSVIYLTDVGRSIAEFARVLRPGGRLYLSSNAIGWYLHNLINGHNGSPSYCPRLMAAATLANSVAYRLVRRSAPNRQVVTPSAAVVRELNRSGFELLARGGEGLYAAEGHAPGPPFYKASYFGVEGVYELIARKRA